MVRYGAVGSTCWTIGGSAEYCIKDDPCGVDASTMVTVGEKIYGDFLLSGCEPNHTYQ
jgi:hypothetical protein